MLILFFPIYIKLKILTLIKKNNDNNNHENNKKNANNSKIKHSKTTNSNKKRRKNKNKNFPPKRGKSNAITKNSISTDKSINSQSKKMSQISIIPK